MREDEFAQIKQWSQTVPLQTPGTQVKTIRELVAEVERLRKVLGNTSGRLRTAAGWVLPLAPPPLYMDEAPTQILMRWHREIEAALAEAGG